MKLDEPHEILEPTAQRAMDKKKGKLPSPRMSSPAVNLQVSSNRRPKRISKKKQWDDNSNIEECKPCVNRAKRKHTGSSSSPTPSKLSNWDDLSETGKWMEELRPFTRSRTGHGKREAKTKKENQLKNILE